MNSRYATVAERAGHRCEFCHAPEALFNSPFEVEHIVPKSRSGLDDEMNWALACRSCNVRKSDHITAFDEKTQMEVRLFHPRQEDWTGHFLVNLVSGEIEGKTPVGRVTVIQLGMNNPRQVEARRLWIRLGLFP